MVKSNVKVVVRTRPTGDFADKNVKINAQARSIDLHMPKGEGGGPINNQQENYHMAFDEVLHNATQEKVFDICARETIADAMQGYNGTVMAYGQTGSGKTFTMTGGMGNFKYRGIIPRTISAAYNQALNMPEQIVTIRVSYVEIYNEVMIDLLAGDSASLETELSVQEDLKGNVTVKGLRQRVATSEEEALHLFFEGDASRTVATHSMNTSSSRSHAVFTLHIESRSKMESTEKLTLAKIHLVDLAGSERLKKTGSNGATLKEASYINRSLSFLEQVVIALGEKGRAHVPYRSSRLTHMLKLLIKYERDIRNLKQELAMHDTLAGRHGMVYDSYSIDERRDLEAALKEFLEGDAPEFEIQSLQQVREAFAVFRKLWQSGAGSRGQGGTGGGSRGGESAGAAGVPAGEGAAGVAGAGADGGSAGAPGAGGAAGVGEEEATGGLSVGLAKDQTKRKDERDAPSPTSPPKSPTPDGGGGSGADAATGDTAPPKAQAFLAFKEADGKHFEEAFRQNKSDQRQKKTEMQKLAEDINQCKRDMEHLKAEIERVQASRGDGGDVVNDEEFALIDKMRQEKKRFREALEGLRHMKADLQQIEHNINQCKLQVVGAFEEWFALTYGHLKLHPSDQCPGLDSGTFIRSPSPTTRSPTGYGGDRAPGSTTPSRSNGGAVPGPGRGGAGEDLLDEAEKFEILETQRFEELHPDALAFHNANALWTEKGSLYVWRVRDGVRMPCLHHEDERGKGEAVLVKRQEFIDYGQKILAAFALQEKLLVITGTDKEPSRALHVCDPRRSFDPFRRRPDVERSQLMTDTKIVTLPDRLSIRTDNRGPVAAFGSDFLAIVLKHQQYRRRVYIIGGMFDAAVNKIEIDEQQELFTESYTELDLNSLQPLEGEDPVELSAGNDFLLVRLENNTMLLYGQRLGENGKTSERKIHPKTPLNYPNLDGKVLQLPKSYPTTKSAVILSSGNFEGSNILVGAGTNPQQLGRAKEAFDDREEGTNFLPVKPFLRTQGGCQVPPEWEGDANKTSPLQVRALELKENNGQKFRKYSPGERVGIGDRIRLGCAGGIPSVEEVRCYQTWPESEERPEAALVPYPSTIGCKGCEVDSAWTDQDTKAPTIPLKRKHADSKEEDENEGFIAYETKGSASLVAAEDVLRFVCQGRFVSSDPADLRAQTGVKCRRSEDGSVSLDLKNSSGMSCGQSVEVGFVFLLSSGVVNGRRRADRHLVSR
uniref:Kinesin motor domain-containing protein n=1 Tax=Chromera velia CCMP2878 TaxID=1169474 RepID=A0A0G4GM34_9ALVE|eukprot:Cvel_22510.t1-p1 / transcript=Cvel_22510.t1 / gene=Cvel_22510 / organism=Chromera_velia_CCMP2878 / gene_product=Kinesin-like protein KIF9, putative / transcript_product=Kinesin-like protein KIF9, putative / location=Cvel_scaffold2219:9645-23461(-) / protein_length=1224 / sequence_SO=supercontig / SO=protein_coding / is_pseudo=false